MSSPAATSGNLTNPFDEINAAPGSCRLSPATSSAASLDSIRENASFTTESFAFRSSIDVNRRRAAASASSATTYSTEEHDQDADESDLLSGTPAFRDSLEVVRANMARKRTRATTESDREPLLLHHLPHRDSLDLPRERAAREMVAKRHARAQKVTHRACATVKALVGSALARAKAMCGNRSDSIRDRPIRVLYSTGHKMRSPDYDAWEHAPTRLEHLEDLAHADGFTDVAAWCRLEGIRY